MVNQKKKDRITRRELLKTLLEKIIIACVKHAVHPQEISSETSLNFSKIIEKNVNDVLENKDISKTLKEVKEEFKDEFSGNYDGKDFEEVLEKLNSFLEEAGLLKIISTIEELLKTLTDFVVFIPES